MGQTIKKIWNGVNVILICIIAFLAIALAGVRLIGWDVYVVLSGSMEPVYKTGAVLYLDDVDVNTLEAGDVITYQVSSDTMVTHRIVEVVEQDGQTMYRTKGDANDVEDGSLVPQSQVVGAPVFTIPYLGYLVKFIQSPAGKYAAISVGALMLLMVFLPDFIFEEDDDEEEPTSKSADADGDNQEDGAPAADDDHVEIKQEEETKA